MMNDMMKVVVAAVLPVLFLGCADKPEIIESKCSSCHASSVVYKNRHTPEEWGRIMFGMKARGLKLTPEEEKAVMDILIKQYGTR